MKENLKMFLSFAILWAYLITPATIFADGQVDGNSRKRKVTESADPPCPKGMEDMTQRNRYCRLGNVHHVEGARVLTDKEIPKDVVWQKAGELTGSEFENSVAFNKAFPIRLHQGAEYAELKLDGKDVIVMRYCATGYNVLIPIEPPAPPPPVDAPPPPPPAKREEPPPVATPPPPVQNECIPYAEPKRTVKQISESVFEVVTDYGCGRIETCKGGWDHVLVWGGDGKSKRLNEILQLYASAFRPGEKESILAQTRAQNIKDKQKVFGVLIERNVCNPDLLYVKIWVKKWAWKEFFIGLAVGFAAGFVIGRYTAPEVIRECPTCAPVVKDSTAGGPRVPPSNPGRGGLVSPQDGFRTVVTPKTVPLGRCIGGVC